MNENYSDVEREAEIEFLPHLVNFLKKIRHLEEDDFLQNWMILHTNSGIQDGIPQNGCYPNEDFPFVSQLGLVEYTRIHMGEVAKENPGI